MRTHLEFASLSFPSYPSEDDEVNSGRFGKRLAEFIAERLPTYGFKPTKVLAEDWGWCVTLENETFSLWIGCGNYEEFEDGFLCFIEPSKPFVRRWFSKVSTVETVERLADALQSILETSGVARRLRWWSEEEA